MSPRHSRTRAWIRWLAAQGLPLGDVGQVLGVGLGDVAEVLSRPTVAPTRPPTGRRPAAEGLRSDAGTRVKRMATLGYPPDRIAEVLALDPGQVADFLGRLDSRGRVKPRPSPRSWGPSRGPEYRDDDLVVMPPAVAELGTVEPEICPGMVPSEPLLAISPAMPPAESWGPLRGAAAGPGHPRRCLDRARAEQMRADRRGGILRTVAELARAYRVSVATVNRVLAGRSYTADD